MAAAVHQPVRHRLDVEEYLAFCATDPDRYEHFELVNGEIYEPVAESAAHAHMVETITTTLRRVRIEGQRVYSHGSVRLNGNGMPLPDVYVVTPGGHWEGRQLDLVVEVSQATWAFDTSEKLHNYATGGVRNYFVVQLDGSNASTMACYSQPLGGRYRSSHMDNIDFLLGDRA
jgi:Uma2 family endonuclease